MNWNDVDTISAAVARSNSRRQVIIELGLSVSQSVYHRLEKHCERHGILLDFPNPNSWHRKWSDDVVFVQDSSHINNNIDIKKRYLAMGYAKNVCVECGQGPEWNGQPLTLQLDHINGIHNDHRVENLRILCPNCHTQTPTYAGRCRAGQPRLLRVRTDPASTQPSRLLAD